VAYSTATTWSVGNTSSHWSKTLKGAASSRVPPDSGSKPCSKTTSPGNAPDVTGLTLETLTPRSTVNDISRAWRQFQRARRNPAFGFSPRGESGIHDLLVKAIRVAETSIYVEDQYFALAAAIGGTNELLDALASTVAKSSFRHLVVITCDVGTIQGELYQVNRRRRDLWNRVAGRFSDKVSVWAYKGGQNRCYWLHAKAWIFDDTFAVIGSANFNRRSLSTDGELAVGVVDLEPTGVSN
jgi:phosphatidylserine/phosphatidylglycerophosphate/cardiolipin synthase-like enzyme